MGDEAAVEEGDSPIEGEPAEEGEEVEVGGNCTASTTSTDVAPLVPAWSTRSSHWL